MDTAIRPLEEVIDRYENRWLALIEKDGTDFVVGVGGDAVEAIADAEARGYPEPVLFKVPRFYVALMPAVTS